MIQPAAPETPVSSYRLRLLIWRVLGALIFADGLMWLGLATAAVFHLLPRNPR